MKTRKSNKQNAEWRRVCSAMSKDSIRIGVPRAFLSLLTLFFHHVSDAMAGDDRPDHGLAMMRQGREHYRTPFYFLYAKLRRAEKRMSGSRYRKALQLFHRYLELSKKEENRWKRKRMFGSVTRGAKAASFKPNKPWRK